MFRLLFLIASITLQTSAIAENSPKNTTSKKVASPTPSASASASVSPPSAPAPAPCPSPNELESKDLLGVWRVSQPKDPSTSATLTLERHTEHEDSLRGMLRPSQGQASFTVLLVGDIEDGELVMDESLDGQRISAIWVMHPVPESCGRKWEGERRAAGEESTEALLMNYISTLPAPPPKTAPMPTPMMSAPKKPAVKQEQKVHH